MHIVMYSVMVFSLLFLGHSNFNHIDTFCSEHSQKFDRNSGNNREGASMAIQGYIGVRWNPDSWPHIVLLRGRLRDRPRDEPGKGDGHR